MPVVAIDGPSGSGKSSVSREVARRLHCSYLDTGAMYRAVTWSVRECGIDPADQSAVAQHCRDLDLQVSLDPDVELVSVRGVDITAAIRTHEISALVSSVATNLDVRADLRRRQRELIASSLPTGIVAEGRDITTVVAPDADTRILLTASEEARLARRALQVHGQASAEALEQMRDVVLRRDADDSTVSTFHVAADGVVHLDSSALNFAETVQAVLDVVQSRHTGPGPDEQVSS